MKVLKKAAIISIVGIFAAAPIAGCAQQKRSAKLTATDLFADALKAIKDNNYYEIEGDINLGLKMEASGLSFGVNATGEFESEVDVKSEIVHSDMDINAGMFGLSQNFELESYTLHEDDKVINYKSQSVAGQSDENWSYTIKDANEHSWKSFLEKIDLKNDEFLSGLNKACSDLILEKETKIIDEKECYVVSGILQIDDELFSEITAGAFTVSEVDNLDLDSVWYFTKDKHELKRAELNIDASVKTIQNEMNNFKFTPEKIMLYLDFSFDKSKTVSIPDEIKNNAKESVDSENAFELMTQM